MKHHKYNSKYDPKHIAKQTTLTRASVEVSATAPTVVKIPDSLPGGTKVLDAKAARQAAPAPTQATVSRDDKASQAMVSEGGPATVPVPYAAPMSHPAAIGLATLPAGSIEGSPLESSPAISTKIH